MIQIKFIKFWPNFGDLDNYITHLLKINNISYKINDDLNKLDFIFIGSFIYINPILWPIVICKEIYRFEVNIRGMDDVKKGYYYNALL